MGIAMGCAGALAAVAFLIGLVCSLFANGATFGERMTMATMPAGMTFVAALFLLVRDRWRFASTMRSVRRRLLARLDMSDAQFVEHFPTSEPSLVAQTRQAIAAFFNVPVQKIHSTDSLRKDLGFEALEPGFHSFVALHVLAARKVEPQPFLFHTGDLSDIGDLINEMQRVLDRVRAVDQDEHGAR